jgi:hypothetical protein
MVETAALETPILDADGSQTAAYVQALSLDLAAMAGEAGLGKVAAALELAASLAGEALALRRLQSFEKAAPESAA